LIRKLQAVAIALFVFSTVAWAQQNPFIGTWKLNVAKSNFGTVSPPKSQTRKVEAQGNGAKYTFEGVAADGGKIAYSYSTNYDGKDMPITGVGQANGADTIAITRVNSNTTTSTLKKAGKVVGTTTTTVSKDGKTTTLDSKGVDASGKPRNVVSVYNKQ
jgi:hypothetical protein